MCYIFVFESMCTYRSFVFALNMTRLVIGPLHGMVSPGPQGTEDVALNPVAQRSPQV